LHYHSEAVKKSFPEFIHRKHFVRRITVEKKCLGKER
jgi:hypothetical protein